MRSHAVPVFLVTSLCLIASSPARSAEDAYSLTKSGQQMTADEKTKLEKQVATNPNDVESRTKLLGYYFIKGRNDAEAKSAKQSHIVWFVENAPDSQVLGLPYGQLNRMLDHEGYDRAKQAWLKTIKESPDKLAVLKNASSFFLLHDRSISEEFLVKGQALDATDPHWPASLGHLYSLGLTSLPVGPVRKAAAEKAYRQFEKAYELSDGMKKDALSSDLAKTALAAGLLDDAKSLAGKMLDDDAAGWNRGNRIHHGNVILGQIALLEGNVAEAKSRLLLAGKTSGSPQLNSFGPNMVLVKDLLERGETEVVLEYFGLCKKFWTLGHQNLDRWADDVKANRTPQFGVHLAL